MTTKTDIIRELQQLRRDVDRLLVAVQTLPEASEPGVTPAAPAPTQAPAPPATPPGAAAGAAGMLAAMDLSEPLRDLYVVLLRAEERTLAQLRAEPALAAEAAHLPVLMRTLVRLGHAERCTAADGTVSYRALAGQRGGRVVSQNIWDALEKP